MQSFYFDLKFELRLRIIAAASRSGIVAAAILLIFWSLPVGAQQINPDLLPVVVQPGAPGQPSKILSPAARATLPPRSPKDAEFMRQMIMHHAQAVEMTALIEARTENKDVKLLGARISQSQSDEMNFMRRWLETRGEAAAPPLSKTSGMEMAHHEMAGHEMPSHHHALMPGMLSPEQMNALKKSNGAEFDRLFLSGMIQHHQGALTMVKDLFDTAGAGQDAELFSFATDVDSGQRAEIKIMRNMLGEKIVEEKK